MLCCCLHPRPLSLFILPSFPRPSCLFSSQNSPEKASRTGFGGCRFLWLLDCGRSDSSGQLPAFCAACSSRSPVNYEHTPILSWIEVIAFNPWDWCICMFIHLFIWAFKHVYKNKNGIAATYGKQNFWAEWTARWNSPKAISNWLHFCG